MIEVYKVTKFLGHLETTQQKPESTWPIQIEKHHNQVVMYSEGFLCNRQFPSTTKNLKGIKKESIFLAAGNLQKQTVRAKKDSIILGRKFQEGK